MVAEAEYQEYRDWVSAVLLDYQFIEEGLRWYLATAYKLILKRLDGALPFAYSYDDNDKDALGTLISKFEKVTTNTDLVAELKVLVKSRNAVAHRAFLLSSEQHDDAAHLKKLKIGLETLRVRTNDCVHKIFKETNYLEAKLKETA